MSHHGPGPIIHGQDITNPNWFIVQRANGEILRMTPDAIATEPIAHQWFTGTTNGLIASWPTRDIAESQAQQRGVLLGRIMPRTARDLADLDNDLIVILTDPNGQPLKGAT